MKKKLLEEYLTFSKKERNAVLVLVFLIVMIFILPYYWPSSNDSIDDALIASVDSVTSFTKDTPDESGGNNNGRYDYNEHRLASGTKAGKIELFHFDPNTLSAAGWMRLGLKERTVQTISKYLFRGGKFRMPEDIKKIYGIPPQLAEQLVPYVRFESSEKKQYPRAFPINYPAKKNYEKKLLYLDINDVDSANLVELRGIGPKLAGRIIRFRDRLGGFHSKEQLKEVYGLPDSTLELILPQLEITGAEIKKISVNEADFTALAQHPYIGRNLAKVILSYRHQHGEFNTADELLKIDIITPELVSKLSPYLRFEK